MARQKITAMDRAAEREKEQPSARHAPLVSKGPDQSRRIERTVGNQAVEYLIQTKLKGDQAEDQSDRMVPSTRALIVEDEAKEVEPGQMRKSEFLDKLYESVCGAAQEALSDTMWTAMGCPYIDRWFLYYSGQGSRHIESVIRKYAPETAGVTSAHEYIPAVTRRVRQGLNEWARTGEISEEQEELAQVGGGAAQVEGSKNEVGQRPSQKGSALFKERSGGPKVSKEPGAIKSELGRGRSLDSGPRSQMEAAFGEDFSRVRIHTGSEAEKLNTDLGARAFTIGTDIAFGSGEYQPGTLIGDALIAHELAHVVQQGSASSSRPLQTRGEESNSLEEDADVAAVGAVVSAWGAAKVELADVGKSAMPRLRSGLRLQRCKKGKKDAKDLTEKSDVKDQKAGKDLTEDAGVKDPNAEPKLLTDYASRYPDSADVIRKSPAAMKLVSEADVAGASLGSYSEEGPYKDIRPYTINGVVYLPKSQKDKLLATRNFLFELNNALRKPIYDELQKEAEKGAATSLTAKEFAYKIVEQEVEGMLRLGEVWFDIKKRIGTGEEMNKYDKAFFHAQYDAFKEGKKSKDQLVKETLQVVYTDGEDAGKTIEQHYMDEFKRLGSKK